MTGSSSVCRALAAAVILVFAAGWTGPPVQAGPPAGTTAAEPAATAGRVEAAATAGPVRLNQMQVVGTHNSYHVEPPPEMIALYMLADPRAIELAYTHAPLGEQFENQGVRQIELDVFADPDGNLLRPIGTPGFKTLHIEQIDEGSTCLVLVECLRQVRQWSDAHPLHMPIGIQIEVKEGPSFPGPPDPVPMTPALYDDLDAEIRSVFPPERLIEPDEVRAGHATLEQAVLEDGWPAIDDVRGQVIVVLDRWDADYLVGRPSLEGRVAFTPSTPGMPDAAFIKMNDPTGSNLSVIQDLVSAGYLVRTRADTPVLTAQSGDTTQREAALASGAQWVSTDYPAPGMAERWGTDYVVVMPDGNPARCNPINAPVGCTSRAIEDLPPDPPPPPAPAPPPQAAAVPRPVAVQPRFTG